MQVKTSDDHIIKEEDFMTHERINGGLGVIITEDAVIEMLLERINEKHPPTDDIAYSLYDIQDIGFLSGMYVDETSTIAVYPNCSFNGSSIYPNHGLIIWTKHDIRSDKIAYLTKEHMIKELKKTISEYIDTESIDFNEHCGLILFTEYN